MRNVSLLIISVFGFACTGPKTDVFQSNVHSKKQCFQEWIISSSTNSQDTLVFFEVPFIGSEPILKLKDNLKVGINIKKREANDILIYDIIYQKVDDRKNALKVISDTEVLTSFNDNGDAKKVHRSITFLIRGSDFKLVSNSFNNEGQVNVLMSAFNKEFSQVKRWETIRYSSVISDADTIYTVYRTN